MLKPHWAIGLIGRPYVALARGPDAFDCWGLCVYVWREQFGLAVPDVGCDPADARSVRRAFEAGVASGAAAPIAKPIEGCAVYLSRARLPDHVGIWIDADRGGVLHVIEGLGVVFTRGTALNANGFKVLGYYLPRGFPCPSATL